MTIRLKFKISLQCAECNENLVANFELDDSHYLFRTVARAFAPGNAWLRPVPVHQCRECKLCGEPMKLLGYPAIYEHAPFCSEHCDKAAYDKHQAECLKCHTQARVNRMFGVPYSISHNCYKE